MEQWKIEYFREVYLPGEGETQEVLTTDRVIEEINNWLQSMPDTFMQPMAVAFKRGWDARERMIGREALKEYDSRTEV